MHCNQNEYSQALHRMFKKNVVIDTIHEVRTPHFGKTWVSLKEYCKSEQGSMKLQTTLNYLRMQIKAVSKVLFEGEWVSPNIFDD